MAAKRIKKPAPHAGNSIKSPGERGVNYDQFRPRFSLEHLQSDFCLSLCTQEEKASFADAIHKRSQLTENRGQKTGVKNRGQVFLCA